MKEFCKVVWFEMVQRDSSVSHHRTSQRNETQRVLPFLFYTCVLVFLNLTFGVAKQGLFTMLIENAVAVAIMIGVANTAGNWMNRVLSIAVFRMYVWMFKKKLISEEPHQLEEEIADQI